MQYGIAAVGIGLSVVLVGTQVMRPGKRSSKPKKPVVTRVDAPQTQSEMTPRRFPGLAVETPWIADGDLVLRSRHIDLAKEPTSAGLDPESGELEATHPSFSSPADAAEGGRLQSASRFRAVASPRRLSSDDLDSPQPHEIMLVGAEKTVRTPRVRQVPRPRTAEPLRHRATPAHFERSDDELELPPITLASHVNTFRRVASNDEDEALPRPVPRGQSPRLSFNFQEAPWDLVLKRLADEAGLSLQMDVVPPGTLNYLDPREYSLSEVQDLLNGFLLERNFLLIRRDRSLIVQDISKGIPIGLVPEVPLEEVDRRGLNEVMTVLIPVMYAPAAQAARDIKPFLSPIGMVTIIPHSNRIVLTDTGMSIRRVREILAFEPNDPQRNQSAVYPLRNTKAIEVAKAISDFLGRPLGPGPIGPGIPPGGPIDPRLPPPPILDPTVMVVAEPSTNSLLVSAPPARMQELHEMIIRLDTPPSEVLIQALLVEVELGNVDECGIELGVQDSVLFDRSVVNNVLTVTESVANPATGVVTSSQKIISQTANPGFNFNNQPLGNNTAIHPSKVGGQGLSTLGVGRVNGDLGYGGLVLSAGSESLNVLLRALSEKRKVDILSRPQIRAIDNRPAEIQIGQQVPVVDGVAITGVGSANPIIRQDKAGIILTVTPHIRQDGHVVIDVIAEKSAFNLAKGSGVPIFTDATNGNVIEAPVKDITQARTTVSCIAGQTIAIGGMITKTQVDVERKVPFLGDIPLLGYAFRYNLDETRRRELLIFLTPHIIRDPLIDSEQQKQVEVARTHFPYANAAQIHGEVLAPPPPPMPLNAFGHGGDVMEAAPASERAPYPGEDPRAYPTGPGGRPLSIPPAPASGPDSPEQLPGGPHIPTPNVPDPDFDASKKKSRWPQFKSYAGRPKSTPSRGAPQSNVADPTEPDRDSEVRQSSWSFWRKNSNVPQTSR